VKRRGGSISLIKISEAMDMGKKEGTVNFNKSMEKGERRGADGQGGNSARG